MDIKEYKDKKAKGLSEIVAVGGGHAFAVKRFNQDDGTEELPEITAIDIEVVESRKVELQSEIDDCDLIIADINNIKNK